MQRSRIPRLAALTASVALTLAAAGASASTESTTPTGVIAYTTYENGKDAVHVFDVLRGTGRKLVAVAGGGELEWSPDGTRLAVSLHRDSGNRIHIVTATGRPVSVLMERPTEDGDYSPNWSRDGSRILFSSDRGGRGGFYVVKVNGRGLERRWTPGRWLATGPDWSPDGQTIAFEYRREIYVIGFDARGLRRLTQEGAALHPAWSPDGQRIAYCTPTGIHVIDRDGRRRMRVSRGDDCHPAWSPDGRWIAFSRTPGGILAVRSNGVGLRPLVRAVEATSISWKR